MQAVEDSGWQPEAEEQRCRTGVLLGSGIGGLNSIAETALILDKSGPRRVSPFFIPSALINLASGQVSIRYGFKGPNHAVVTACSTGAHAIGDAARLIMLDDADVMVAGGCEAALGRIGMAGFAAARALSTGFNETPERASRPWDKDRDGFVMAEGAGCVVLEEYEHAKRRGATIYAEVKGYGMSGDAYHVTAPSPSGDGGFRSMQAALKRSGLRADEIDYVNAHGTSTPLGDEIELGRRQAAVRQFGRQAVDVVDQVGDRAPAGCGRRGRGDLLHPGAARPDRPADAQSGQSVGRLRRHRPRPAPGQAARGEGGAVELVRLRRHQCQRDPHGPAHGLSRPVPRWIRGLLIAVAAMLAVSALVAGGGWYLAQHYLRTPGPSLTAVVVDLPRGSGVTAIASRLADAGAIEHPLVFVALARASGRDRTLKAGEYAIEAGMSPEAIMALLESGKVVLHPVAVPEGLTVQEVFAALQASPVLSGELPALPAEGSLLPETYLVPRGEPRADIVQRMHADMQSALGQLWAGRRPDLPLRTPEEALVLASIIEKETAKPDEYRLVAAVFHNRLRQGMPLQTDPTVIYALTGGKGPLGRELLRADLAVDNPYNTYRIAGLPPGPIANPGRGALAAALDPAPVDYLYFVADGTGGHAFAATLAEHNRNVARWRKLRQAGG